MKTCDVQEHSTAQVWAKNDQVFCAFDDSGFCVNEAEVLVQEHAGVQWVGVCATHWDSWRQRETPNAVEKLQIEIEEFLWALV